MQTNSLPAFKIINSECVERIIRWGVGQVRNVGCGLSARRVSSPGDGPGRDAGLLGAVRAGAGRGAGGGAGRGGRVLPQQHQPQPALGDGGRDGDGHGELLGAAGQRDLRGAPPVRHARHGHALQLLAPRHRLHRQQASIP